MATPKTVQSLAGGKWKIDDTGNLIKIGGVLVSDHVGAAIGVGAGGVEFITPLKVAGQLGGTAASPTVLGIRETAGPTLLTVGAVADGETVKRSGSTLIGYTPTGGSGLTHPQVMARSCI